IGVEVRVLAAANALDEVVVVVAAALERLQLLALGGEDDAGIVAGADEVAFRAVEDIAYLGAQQVFARQAAHFEVQVAIAVVEEADLGVGGLAVIDVAEAAADAEHALGQLVLAEAPAGLIHLVDTLVAEIAVAVVPGPVPIVVQVLAAERLLRSGAAPEIVIDRLGQLLLAGNFADRGPQLVAEAASQADLAELSGLHVGDRLAHALVGAALGAGLANPVVLAGRLDDPPAFADIVADWLLDIHVLAGLHRPDGGQSVPVVGRGDGDDVDVLVF